MDDSRIAVKLRDQMVRFSGELSHGLCKPARRFVAEAVYGIQARQSVMLSEIGRALNEAIRLKKTEDRLSNELRRSGLGNHLTERLLRMASSRVREDALLVLDPSDIIKPYARSMEHMTRVRDGSTGRLGNGYWTLHVIGVELDEVRVTPLYHRLYSHVAPGFESENTEILRCVSQISHHTEGRGIWVVDRGGDRRKLYRPFLDMGLRFIIRLIGTRHVECGGRRVLARDVAEKCPMLYWDRVVKEDDGRERVYQIAYGYRRVKLPGRREKLTLVVVRGFGEEPMMMYFAAVYLGDRARLRILAHYALRAGRRLFGIPDFRYYALADGIKRLLEALRRPFVARLVLDPSLLQPNLFDP